MADSFNGLTADAGVPAPVRMRELLLGFVTSMALYTVAELDTATALLDGPKTVQELADIAGADATGFRNRIEFLFSRITSLFGQSRYERTITLQQVSARQALETSDSAPEA